MASKKGFYGGATLLFCIGLLLFAAGWIMEYVAFPAIVKHQIKKSMFLGLKNNGELNDFADDWLNSKFTVKMQYYVYDYTNALEMVNRGMKPDAVERGPYTYRQVNNYTYYKFSDDGNYMEYIEESLYFFDPASSCDGCDPKKDFVIVPDLPFFQLSQQIGTLLGFLPFSPDLILNLFKIPFIGYNSGPYVKVNVDDLIMRGYTSPIKNMLIQLNNNIADPFLNLVLNAIIEDIPVVALNSNNGTLDETFYYTINTGKSDYRNVGEVVSLRKDLNETGINHTPSSFWNGSSVNCSSPGYASALRGTNGDFFAPFVKKDTVLSAYIEDICRSIDFVYSEESKVGDIDTYRFVIDPKAFDYSYPENCGFCYPVPFNMYNKIQNDSCLPNGLLDVSQCRTSGTANTIVLSNPHFFQADRSVQTWFPRMKPDSSKHQTFLDIEPNSGTVLAAHKRLQINVFGGSSPGPYSLVPSGVYPLGWVDNSYLADDDTLKKVTDDLYHPRKIVKLVSFIAGVGFGAVLMIIGTSMCLFRIIKERNRPPSSLASSLTRQADTMGSPPVYRRHEDGLDSTLVKRLPRAKQVS